MILGHAARPLVSAKSTEDWFSPGRFALTLGLLLSACFPNLVAGVEALAYGDAGLFAYPVAYYFRQSFWRGEIPLWNPLNSCGIPFLAQWNTLTLYPLSLFYLLLPMPWSFGMFCLGHLFLAGAGMYFLAHSWTGNRLAAAVAGAVFAFNGLTWYGLMWPHIVAALGWMPWVVLTMERAWLHGGRCCVLAALVAAMQLLSGGAEVILQTWLVLGALWVVGVFGPNRRPGTLALRAAGTGCLAAGLAAVQLLPFLDLTIHSQRSAGFGAGAMGAIAAMPLTGWANYFVPLFRCVRNPNGVFVQAGQSWTGSYYLGVGTVALAALAVWRVRDRRVRTLAALALFGLLMALGNRGWVYAAIRYLIPPLGFVRFPVKFVVLPTFALPLLAGYGLQWLLGLPEENWAREWRKTRWLLLGLLGLIGVILGAASQFPLPGVEFDTTLGNAAVRILFLVLIFGCLGLLRRQTEPKTARLLQTGLVVLLWFDIFTHSSNLSPCAPPAALEPNIVRQFFHWDRQPAAGGSRAFESKEALWQMLSHGSTNLETDISARRLSLFMNFNLLDEVPKFDGFYALDLKDYLEVFKHVYFTASETSRLQDFLGISFAGNPTNLVDWVPRDHFLPLITGGQKPMFANGPDTMNAILRNNFEPLQVVYLPPEAQGRILAVQPARVRIVASLLSARHLQADVESPAPALIVAAQAYYHPWHAYVDGKPTALWKANYAFQALEVAPGKHRVDLRYEDRAFLRGAVLSMLALLGCAAAWLLWRPGSGLPAKGFTLP